MPSIIEKRDGNVAITVAILAVPVVLMIGAGIDLARYEAIRIDLQDGIDRGVLAASALSQTREPEQVLRSYMKNISYVDDVKISFKQEKSPISRKVSAKATYTFSTAFLHLAGIPKITVNAASAAEEARQNIELSLMLDVSGSMAENNRFKNLKVAAQQFVDTILTADTKDYTTLSIVPYAGHVNVGSAVFNALGGTRSHANSSCLEFNDKEYGGVVPDFTGRAQVPHFTQWNFNNPVVNWWWCPVDDTSIAFLSNDAKALKNRISQLKMHDGTGTQNAMQWGYMLLQPGAKSIVKAAIKTGQMSENFENRPAPFTDATTKKYMVLMTDGKIVEQYRPKDYARPVSLPPDNTMSNNSATSKERLFAVCDAAKEKKIIVFTIGFEVDEGAAAQMKYCATSPAHYYSVAGLEIGDAFKSISATINKLKLTQ